MRLGVCICVLCFVFVFVCVCFDSTCEVCWLGMSCGRCENSRLRGCAVTFAWGVCGNGNPAGVPNFTLITTRCTKLKRSTGCETWLIYISKIFTSRLCQVLWLRGMMLWRCSVEPMPRSMSGDDIARASSTPRRMLDGNAADPSSTAGFVGFVEDV